MQIQINLMKPISLTLLAILIFAFVAPKKETVFIGKISTTQNNKTPVLGILIEIRVDTTVIAKTTTDKFGAFKVSVSTSKEFDIYFCGVGTHQTFVQSVPPTDKDSVLMLFKMPKDYIMKFGRAYCPKCKKHDMTLPIRFTSPTTEVFVKIDSNGDTIRTNYDRKYYYEGSGGCIGSEFDPKYYCKRDKIKY